MHSQQTAGKLLWLFVPIAVVPLAVVLATAVLRHRASPRTAAQKLQVAAAYQEVGYEPCHLCFGRAEETCRRPKTALYARKVSQDPAIGYCTIFICRSHPWPLDHADQQQALRNWKDVQIEWWRAQSTSGLIRPESVERAVRDFEGAVLTTPAFLRLPEGP